MLISIVVPCYNEEQALPLFVQSVYKVLAELNEKDCSLSFELILIDDGSSDKTVEIFDEISRKVIGLCKVRWFSLSRNFGKESALYAGLDKASGDYVVTMDADMQDPPSFLPKMLDIIKNEDCENVAIRRVSRKGEPLIRSGFARLFYRLINKFSDIEIVDGARDYRLMTRKMVDAILAMKERNRFSKGIWSWVGFKTKWLEFEHVNRIAGETKWSFWALFRYAVEGIVAFSTVPLVLAAILGVVLCLVALVLVIFIMVRTAVFGDPVAGWPSLFCTIMLLGGLQLLSLGIVGEYLGKTYLESKQRPIYIINKTNDAEVEENESDFVL